MKSILTAFFVLAACAGGFCQNEQVSIKGYYQEDGTYVKQRVMDPIQKETEVLPLLSKELKIRREQISRYYKGKVFTTKVSFPASHSGIVLYGGNLGRTNVDLFKNINKYGNVINKGEKVLITKFDIGRKTIDIDLNN